MKLQAFRTAVRLIFYMHSEDLISLLRNVKCEAMLTEAYLEPSRISTMELFSLWLSYVLKTYLI